ncbi:uncharacterized protein [Battus philenor]|uniref:uncharacterized protein n=1 Tax=Battus philenor TaxID=42288 RepID=UPI0035D12E87
MENASNMLELYMDISERKSAYCALCLRTEEETQLTAPLVFQKALGALKCNISDFRSNKLCNTCEPMAAAVANFVDMVHYAQEIRMLVETAKRDIKIMRKKRLQQTSSLTNLIKRRKLAQLNCTKALHANTSVSNVATANVTAAQITENHAPKVEKHIPETETIVINDEESDNESVELVSFDSGNTKDLPATSPTPEHVPPELLPSTSNAPIIEKGENKKNEDSHVDADIETESDSSCGAVIEASIDKEAGMEVLRNQNSPVVDDTEETITASLRKSRQALLDNIRNLIM